MKLSLSLGALSGANIFMTLLIQWYVLVKIGPGIQTDALFASLTLPQFVLAVVSQSLMHVLVPLLTTTDEAVFWKNAWGFMILIGGLFSLVAFVLLVLASVWVPLLVPGFSASGKALTIDLARIQLLSMVFTAISSVLLAINHARQRFIWAETTPILGSILGFGILIWGLEQHGILLVAWITAFRLGVQTLLLLAGMQRYHQPDWHAPELRLAWQKIKPLLVGTAYYKTDPLIDRLLSSLTTSGGLSLLYLGQQLYSMATQIANSAVAAPMVPALSQCASQFDWIAFRRIYRHRITATLALTGTGYLVLLVMGRFILNLLVGYGEVTQKNVGELWWLMVLLVGFPVGGVLGQILASSFYAKGNTTTPTKIGVTGFTLGAILKVGLFLLIGLNGIALGTTLHYLINALVLFIFLEREIQIATTTRS